MDSTLIWVLLAVLVVLVLVAIWAFVNNQKKNRLRGEAEHMRQRAAGGEPIAEDREAVARQTQQEAEVARERAERARQEAAAQEEEAAAREKEARASTAEAREQRDHVTDTYIEADEIDPDTKR